MNKRWITYLAALAGAGALAGCMGTVRGPGYHLDSKRAGERLVVIATIAEGSVTKKYTKDGFELQKKIYQEVTGRPFPPDMELVKANSAYDGFGGDMGNLFMVPVPKAWGVETGDYIEIIHPGPNEYATAVRIVNKWNDPTPGGCYWVGPYARLTSGRVVCKDHAPEAPERRRGFHEFGLSYHGKAD